MDYPLVKGQQTEAVEVSGILFLSFVQACTNLDCYVDETVTDFLVDVRPDGWYALERYTHLLATVAERYARPAIILEQLGAEMMRLWYEMGPGKVLVQEGLDLSHIRPIADTDRDPQAALARLARGFVRDPRPRHHRIAHRWRGQTNP